MTSTNDVMIILELVNAPQYVNDVVLRSNIENQFSKWHHSWTAPQSSSLFVIFFFEKLYRKFASLNFSTTKNKTFLVFQEPKFFNSIKKNLMWKIWLKTSHSSLSLSNSFCQFTAFASFHKVIHKLSVFSAMAWDIPARTVTAGEWWSANWRSFVADTTNRRFPRWVPVILRCLRVATLVFCPRVNSFSLNLSSPPS